MRDKWTKSRDEAAKKEEELIVVKALLKQKEVSLHQAAEVRQKFLFLGKVSFARPHWAQTVQIFKV